jgi:hypothetical protein
MVDRNIYSVPGSGDLAITWFACATSELRNPSYQRLYNIRVLNSTLPRRL